MKPRGCGTRPRCSGASGIPASSIASSVGSSAIALLPVSNRRQPHTASRPGRNVEIATAATATAATATAATATAFAGAMSARTRVKGATRSEITAVNERNDRTVKTATRAPNGHSGTQGRLAASVPWGRIARNGPNRASSVPRNAGARQPLRQARLIRGKAITSASAAVAAAATAAKGVNAPGIHRSHLGARKSELQPVPPRSKDRHRRLPHQNS